MSFHVSFSPFEFFPHTPATTETGMNTEYRPHDHGKNIYKINNTKSKKKNSWVRWHGHDHKVPIPQGLPHM